MGLTDSRKTAQKLVDSRKNWKILTVSRRFFSTEMLSFITNDPFRGSQKILVDW